MLLLTVIEGDMTEIDMTDLRIPTETDPIPTPAAVVTLDTVTAAATMTQSTAGATMRIVIIVTDTDHADHIAAVIDISATPHSVPIQAG